jgi:hypothetical protein
MCIDIKQVDRAMMLASPSFQANCHCATMQIRNGDDRVIRKALKGRDVKARGAALGTMSFGFVSSERAEFEAPTGMSPFQGLILILCMTQGCASPRRGFALGYHILPFQGKDSGQSALFVVGDFQVRDRRFEFFDAIFGHGRQSQLELFQRTA